MAFGEIIIGEKAKQQFLTENPDLVSLSNETIICFGNRQRTIDACFIGNIIEIVFFIVVIIMLMGTFFRIQSTKETHKTAYKLQVMLFRALLVQLFNFYVFILVPCKFVQILIFCTADSRYKAYSI
jgi:hypothetical protein